MPNRVVHATESAGKLTLDGGVAYITSNINIEIPISRHDRVPIIRRPRGGTMKNFILIHASIVTLLLSAPSRVISAGNVVYAWAFPYQNYKIPYICDSTRYIWLDSLNGKTWYVPDSVTEFYPGGETVSGRYAFFGVLGNGYGVKMPLNIVYLLDNSSAANRIDPNGLRFQIITTLLNLHIVTDTVWVKRENSTAGFLTFGNSICQQVPLLDVSSFTTNQQANRRRLLDSLESAANAAANDHRAANINAAIDTALTWLKKYPNRSHYSRETAIVIVSAGIFDDDTLWRTLINRVYPDSTAPYILGICLSNDTAHNDLCSLTQLSGGDCMPAVAPDSIPSNIEHYIYYSMHGDAPSRLTYSDFRIFNRTTEEFSLPVPAIYEELIGYRWGPFVQFKAPIPLCHGLNEMILWATLMDSFGNKTSIISRAFSLVVDTTGEHSRPMQSGEIVPRTIAATIPSGVATSAPYSGSFRVTFGSDRRLEIIMPARLNETAYLSVYDLHGRLCISAPLAKGAVEYTVASPTLPKGAYIVRVTASEKEFRMRFVMH
jgi:hypothetical protein